ncbi:MAG TPA: hypothetical protein VEK10_06365 [Steroidobacteraceae bacterium]|nr:hypothetical protein [Steroidobacteraceae bacterium]
MNRFVTKACRDLACGAAAALITLILGMSFVESTAVPPGARSASAAPVVLTPVPAWFGQPEPAVLVD